MNLILALEDFERVLAEIKKNDGAKIYNIMANCGDFIDKLQLMVNIQSIGLHLERAKKYYGNEKEIAEKGLLFDAYCKIKANNISDADLQTTNLQDYSTGNNLTLGGIEQRLVELGWKE